MWDMEQNPVVGDPNWAKNALRFALGRPVPEILTFQINIVY